MFELVLIIVFFVLGSGIKFIDLAFDNNLFSRQNALFFSPFLGVLWAFAMFLSTTSFTILGAVFLSVVFGKKVNNPAFLFGALTVVFVLVGLSFFTKLSVFWLPLFALAIAGLLDEYGNDLMQTRAKAAWFIRKFFEHRFAMKATVFTFAFFGVFGWIYFFAFLAFDMAYALVDVYSRKLKKNPVVFS